MRPTQPLRSLQVDFTSMPGSGRVSALMVIVDTYSKLVYLHPTPTADNAAEVIKGMDKYLAWLKEQAPAEQKEY
eukprot:38249-Eustigmatos_ZCMA.PRE.1